MKASGDGVRADRHAEASKGLERGFDVVELGLGDEPTAKGLLRGLSQQLGREPLARAVVQCAARVRVGTAPNQARSSGATSAWWSTTSGGTRKRRLLQAAREREVHLRR